MKKYILLLLIVMWTQRGFYSRHSAMLFINALPEKSQQSAYIVPGLALKNTLINYRVVYPIVVGDN